MISISNVVKLIEAHNNNDDKIFKEYSYKVAKELDKQEKFQIAEHIMAITSGTNLWTTKDISPLPDIKKDLKKLCPYVTNDYHKESLGIFYSLKIKKFATCNSGEVAQINGIRFEKNEEVKKIIDKLLDKLNILGGFSIYEFEKLCCEVFGVREGV